MAHRPHNRTIRWLGGLSTLSGVFILLSAVVADLIGIGSDSRAQTFGRVQLSILIAGVLIVWAGLILIIKPGNDPRNLRQYLADRVFTPLNTLARNLSRPELTRWLIVAVLLLSAALRFHGLDAQSLWLDELMTWYRSRYDTVSAVVQSARMDVWPPGYSVFIFYWMKWVGCSEFLLRFPAALSGVMAVAAIYTLGKRLVGQGAAFGAAGMMAVLQTAVAFSQEARPYAALILFTTLSTYCWFRFLQGLRPDQRLPLIWMGGYMVFALLMAYWHYYGLLMVALQGIGAGLWQFRNRHAWPKIVAVYGMIGLGYAFWIPDLLKDFQSERSFADSPGTYADELVQYFRFMLSLSPDVLAVIGLLAAAAVGHAILNRRERKRGLPVWALLVGWVLLPFSITYLKSVLSAPTLVDRYLLISLPAICLLIATALARLPVRPSHQAGWGLIVAVILFPNFVLSGSYYIDVSKTQFREAAYYVLDHDSGEAGDSLLMAFAGYPGNGILFDYYFEQGGSPRRVELSAGFGDDIAWVEDELQTRDPATIWLMAAHLDPAEAFVDYLAANYRLVEHQSFYRAGVWLFEQRQIQDDTQG